MAQARYGRRNRRTRRREVYDYYQNHASPEERRSYNNTLNGCWLLVLLGLILAGFLSYWFGGEEGFEAFVQWLN